MNEIIQHREVSPWDIAQTVLEEMKKYEQDEWPRNVAEAVPAEFLLHLIAQTASVEERLSYWKRVAGEKAMIEHDTSARAVSKAANVSPATATAWKREPLSFELDSEQEGKS